MSTHLAELIDRWETGAISFSEAEALINMLVREVKPLDIEKVSLSEAFKQARAARGETLDVAAKAIGVSKPHLHSIESGKSSNPAIKTVVQAAMHYGVSIEVLAGLKEMTGRVNPSVNTGCVVKLPSPENMQRVETGAVQFGDDWPGVFIRGDNAAHYSMAIDGLLRGEIDPIALGVLSGLNELLKSCDVRT
ncbi:hypothetical protein DN730_09795 [Marinomonas piezotolerans]|uniref:HTH cro/C1-type domain-containing protein n=1 Tax=Marinomonas piezotolerans TaxID=2213058 RepID=A0A370UA89_9GAMM|nr:helix-turn-helix transcriptional regulator [Marinomonas piezotolerans]RDL44668.1 hypothetical protein DN730_09795 [Marinomonas piezotolerans]